MQKVGGWDRDLVGTLERVVESATRGDPQSPLGWATKNLMQLKRELGEQDRDISHVSVGIVPKDLGYDLQANRKTLEGTSHPDRNAQFEYINDKTKTAPCAGQLVIYVDTKKKEPVSCCRNNEQERPNLSRSMILWTKR